MKYTIVAAAMMATVLPACAQENLIVLEPKPSEPGPGEMLYTYLQREAHAALDQRLERYEQLKTRDDVAAYQQELRAFFLEQLGGFPERTPLNARTVATLERDGYRVEKVIFESRPGFHVTGLLHLPATPGPYPAVLVPCGHSANGKAAEPYQRGSILMARHGVAARQADISRSLLNMAWVPSSVVIGIGERPSLQQNLPSDRPGSDPVG